MAGAPLLPLDRLGDPGAESVVIGEGEGRRDIVVVRVGGRILAYRNACPHRGTPLETLPGRFFTADGARLLCSTHGAEFEIGDGLCVAGPCLGRRLAGVPVEVVAGMVHLAG